MKTYFLALRNEDFSVNSNVWTTDSIDLYANKFYTNYSVYRSPYGQNLLGDFTFTGTETLPSATPSLPNTTVVTNYGEIVTDQDAGQYYIYNYSEEDDEFFYYNLVNGATPYRTLIPTSYNILQRFVDMSSQIDILGFKHAFSNLKGTENPTFSLKIKTSPEQSDNDSDWRQISNSNENVSVLFLRNVNRYNKFEITFNSETDLSDSKFLLLVQINIADPISPVITDHTRSMLSRFPGWTKIYQDSLEKSTPSLALPESNAGKFLNAVSGELLDRIDGLITRVELDSFIQSVDLEQVDWMYVSQPVEPGFIKVRGDGIELTRLSSFEDLVASKLIDNVFFYNFLTFQLYTLKNYTTLYTDKTSIEQIPIQNFNIFDEFGLRVGLQRLYLESNQNFKNRILDVYINPPDISASGLKRTLRRELDIWRAYDATPDSQYQGATPEIFEISDILNSAVYFNEEGNPKKEFFDLVEDLNKRFPSNYGYIKWGEAYWDYAGIRAEGVSRIPQYTDATPLATQNYQPGIGDFEDARLVLEKLDRRTKEYSFGLRAHGYKYDTLKTDNYEPIKVAYDTYLSYSEPYYDHDVATVNYEIYLKLNQHGYINSNRVFKADLTDYVKNAYAPDSPSSPEYITKDIFGPSGLTSNQIVFYSVDAAATPYLNTITPSATESYTISQIPLFAVQQATINYISSKDPSGSTGNYVWASFSSGSMANNSSKVIVKNFSTPTYSDGQIRLNSNIYTAAKNRTVQTQKVRYFGDYTIINYPSVGSSKSNITMSITDVLKNFNIPNNATPLYIHVDNVLVGSYEKAPIYDSSKIYGGISVNRDENEPYYIASSPNINISLIGATIASPSSHGDYDDTVGSTVNYFFTQTRIPFSSTPSSIVIRSKDGEVYPFKYPVWEEFSANSIAEYDFYMSENGVVHASPNINQDLLQTKNSNVIDYYTIQRSDFGLGDYASSPNLYFTSVEAINENDEVTIWTDYNFIENEKIVYTDDLEKNVSLNYYDSASGIYKISSLPVKAQFNYDSTKYISPSIKTGWYFQDGERFIYADPKVDASLNQPEVVLEQLARKGSPIIVSTIDSSGSTVNYNQVSFFDEATPSMYSHYNYEYITAKNANVMYLAYSNVFDVTIVDTYTGETVCSGLSSEDNSINIISIPENQPFKIGRSYRASYRVVDVFNVDNQYFNTVDNDYRTKVALLSTPNSSYRTYITYESALQDDDYELPELKLNPLYSALDSGYVYLSHEEYDYDTFDYILSPKQVLADGKDSMILNVFSKDINGNPKPYSNFVISGSNISSTPSTVTSNVDGYARSQIKYTGSNVPYESSSYLYIKDENNYSSTVNYFVKPNKSSIDKLTAEVDARIITADGVQTVKINGQTNPDVYVYWRKARNLKDLFDISYNTSDATPGKTYNSGRVLSNSEGYFNIGNFIAQGDATPGYWFTSVETNLNKSDGTPNSTSSGDIVYWYEKYDSTQSTLDEPILRAGFNLNPSYKHYASNAAFKVNSLTEQVYYNSSATPTWNLPDWYPISRYTQYEMGLLGATPYVVEYSDLHPDYEEE